MKIWSPLNAQVEHIKPVIHEWKVSSELKAEQSQQVIHCKYVHMDSPCSVIGTHNIISNVSITTDHC